MSKKDPSDPTLLQSTVGEDLEDEAKVGGDRLGCESEESESEESESEESESEESESEEPSRPPLPLEEHWSCVACGHYETFEFVRCGGCKRFRILTLSDTPILAKSPIMIPEEVSTSPEDQRLLNVAFERLQELFLKAQVEGRTLDEADRAKLYETLLISFLKIEREEVRRVAFRDVFQEGREEKKRSHMIHLSIIWFLGICTGFALYFALDSVR